MMSVTRIVNLCRVFVCLSVALFSFSACSKDDNNAGGGGANNYHFTATFNGTKKDFSHTLKFQGGGNDGRWEHIVVGGYESPFPNAGGTVPPSYDFELWRVGSNITAGTYTTQSEKEMISRYAIQTTNGTLLYNTLNDADNFTLHIEKISKDGIKGTFEGTIRNAAGAAIQVTEGSFELPYDKLVNP